MNAGKSNRTSPGNGKENQMKAMELVFGMATALSLIGQGLVSGSLAADVGQTNVTVEVLIFSGRPNPTWQLQDPKPLESLKAKMKDLPEAFKEEPAGWSRLGFTGFRIHGGDTVGLPGEIRVYQGVIKTGHGKTAQYLKDSAGLEQSLINEAKKQALEPPVRDAIASYEQARKGAK
jgi:hypothetical protein